MYTEAVNKLLPDGCKVKSIEPDGGIEGLVMTCDVLLNDGGQFKVTISADLVSYFERNPAQYIANKVMAFYDHD